MTSYHERSFVPPLVSRALTLAREQHFSHSSLPEVGRLLAVVAATIERGSIGEIGTGCGVGAAWIATALRPGVSLFTIDNDSERVELVRSLFEQRSQVHVLHGDWMELRGYGPFALLFADGGKAKQEHPETLIEMIDIGGLIVLDDLTPEEYWPDEWKDRPDPVRDFWLNSDRVQATEVRVTERHVVLLASRVS